MTTAVLVPPRPAVSFGDDETVSFTTEQAARAYVDTRVAEHFRALGADPDTDVAASVTDSVCGRVFDGAGKTVSLRGIEALVHTSTVTALY